MSVLKFVNPKTYISFIKCAAAKHAATTRKDITEGSIAPLFRAMLLVGSIGYTMEYFGHLRPHVLAKQAVVNEALKNHHH